MPGINEKQLTQNGPLLQTTNYKRFSPGKNFIVRIFDLFSEIASENFVNNFMPPVSVMRCAILDKSLFGACMVVWAHANAC